MYIVKKLSKIKVTVDFVPNRCVDSANQGPVRKHNAIRAVTLLLYANDYINWKVVIWL